MSDYKLGKLPATYDKRDLSYAALRPTISLPPVPSVFGHGNDFSDWGMAGNGPDNSVFEGFEGCGDCFPAGTRVLMADGSTKPIEEIRTLDRVVSHEGNICEVSATRVLTHIGDLVSIKLWGHRHLRCTPDHRIFTRRGWVAATRLQVGDWVKQPRWRPEIRRAILVEDYLTVERRVRQKGTRTWSDGSTSVITALPETITLTPAFGRLVGLFLAEGSTTQNLVRFTFGAHEQDTLVAECVGLLRDLGAEPDVRVRERYNRVDITVCGKHWRMLWEVLCAKGAGLKRLHSDLHAGPDDFRRAVLDGWLDGDGHRRRSERAGATVSHSMALDMMTIGLSLGENPTIRFEPRQDRQDRWVVTFRDGDPRHVNGMNDDGEDACWRRVRGVEAEQFVGHVFDITVDDDHSFIAETLAVHNCAWAGPAHETIELCKDAGRPVPDFTGKVVVEQYSEYSGYNPKTGENDTGSNVRDVLNWRRTKGLRDATGGVHKIGVYVALETKNLQHIIEAAYLFECVGIGIEVPESAEQQFAEGSPWSVVPGAGIVGGHYVPVVGRPEDGMLAVVTWAKRQLMTEQFYTAFGDESWAYVSGERINTVTGKSYEHFGAAELEHYLSAL